MLAFAGNSLLCRLALRDAAIDAVSFTTVRLVSGAIVLWIIVRARQPRLAIGGNWLSAGALFAYAIAFSLAYISLAAGTGALLMNGMVKVTMLSVGLARGERFTVRPCLGFSAAVIGLAVLLSPSMTAPPVLGAGLMLLAGLAWGVYSLRGRGGGDAIATTAGNFLRTVPLTLLASAVALPWLRIDISGALYAIASGAIASGVGYAIWCP